MEHLILALEARRIGAMVKKEIATLDELLADDLSYTHSGGYSDTKTSFITFIRDKGNYLGVEYLQKQVIPWGDSSVIVRGVAVISLVDKAPYQVFFLDIWALRDGAWKMIAWQATRVVEHAAR